VAYWKLRGERSQAGKAKAKIRRVFEFIERMEHDA
jgi:hypothetical protein